MTPPCHCCGRYLPMGRWAVSGGKAMHPECWNDHHSHPIDNPWPPNHVCAKDVTP